VALEATFLNTSFIESTTHATTIGMLKIYEMLHSP
tara:strand:- start:478 stop:582 length:105 start_codon:yes stop_codon:yes gene_type:complete